MAIHIDTDTIGYDLFGHVRLDALEDVDIYDAVRQYADRACLYTRICEEYVASLTSGERRDAWERVKKYDVAACDYWDDVIRLMAYYAVEDELLRVLRDEPARVLLLANGCLGVYAWQYAAQTLTSAGVVDVGDTDDDTWRIIAGDDIAGDDIAGDEYWDAVDDAMAEPIASCHGGAWYAEQDDNGNVWLTLHVD